jgi:phosphate/sulfate permease
MDSVQIGFWVVVLLVVLAVGFDFMNGFHDAANSIATVVSTGVLKPQQAVLFAAFFNVVAISIFQLKVAATVGKGIAEPGVIDHHVVFGALIGAIVWNIVTWWYGIPSSSSHALIGGIVGSVVAKAGATALVGAGLWKTVIFIFVSPALGFVLGSLLMVIVAWICRNTSPLRVDRWFRRLQLVSAGLYSLGHGGNDAQKTIGIIWMLLIAAGYHRRGHHVRRLAHRQDHGSAHHQAQAGGRFLCRDGRRDHAVHRHRHGRAGVDHAHHHRRDRGCRLDPACVGRALGRGGQHRLGLDLHDSGFSRGCRRGLSAQPAGFLIAGSIITVAGVSACHSK